MDGERGMAFSFPTASLAATAIVLASSVLFPVFAARNALRERLEGRSHEAAPS